MLEDREAVKLAFYVTGRFVSKRFAQFHADEIAQLARITNWKCSQTYDASKSKYSYYFTFCFRNALSAFVYQYSKLFKRTEREVKPEDVSYIQEIKESSSIPIHALSELQMRVIREIYWNEKKSVEIAKELGVSKQRISQIHAKALEVLRDRIASS